MKPNPDFLNQPKHFWANVRSISQHAGYSAQGQILVHDLPVVADSLKELGLSTNHVIDDAGKATKLGAALVSYFQFRADVLNKFVKPRLMSAEQAADAFAQVRKLTRSIRAVRVNTQKIAGKKPAYLTGMVDMLIEANIGGLPCDFNPQELTTFTHLDAPLRTLARRVDGAFPSAKNPVAIWEIKEYYYTETFGSRCADGVYESLLDGMELEELRQSERIDCKHYFIIDAIGAWWTSKQNGRSYLCRIIDMLHMGYVDEVLFGTEVLDEIPRLAKEWVALHKSRR